MGLVTLVFGCWVWWNFGDFGLVLLCFCVFELGLVRFNSVLTLVNFGCLLLFGGFWVLCGYFGIWCSVGFSRF